MGKIDHLIPNIKNIIFDLGGVILNISYDAPIDALENLGATGLREKFSQAQQDPIFDMMDKGLIGNVEFLEKFRSMADVDVSVSRLTDIWNSILGDLPEERMDIIHKLKTRYRTFLLSNTNSIHVEAFKGIIDRSLGWNRFSDAFEKMYFSNEIRLRKPDPIVFRKVCEWNDLIPAETLFIDDSIQHVEGARHVGLHAYHLDTSEEDILQLFANWVGN